MAVARASSAGVGVGRITLEEHVAARPMQFGVERAMADPFGCHQCLVEDGEGTVEIACPSFGVDVRNLDEPVVKENVLLAQQFGAATDLLEATPGRAACISRQALKKGREGPPRRQIVLPRESGELNRVRHEARDVAAH